MDVIDELKVNVWESGGDRHCGTVVVVGVARVVAMGAVAWLLLDEDISEELGGINGGLSVYNMLALRRIPKPGKNLVMSHSIWEVL